MSADLCKKCGRALGSDDIGFYKKMVNRGAETFCCFECTCAHFKITPETGREMIERFKKQGCTLFC